jgi:hypothetical protein
VERLLHIGLLQHPAAGWAVAVVVVRNCHSSGGRRKDSRRHAKWDLHVLRPGEGSGCNLHFLGCSCVARIG